MKNALMRITDPIVRIGGLISGAMYLPQTWKIVQHPEVAVGISLITFGFLNVLQLAAAINCHLKNNRPMAQGMFVAFIGSVSVTFATVYARVFLF